MNRPKQHIYTLVQMHPCGRCVRSCLLVVGRYETWPEIAARLMMLTPQLTARVRG